MAELFIFVMQKLIPFSGMWGRMREGSSSVDSPVLKAIKILKRLAEGHRPMGVQEVAVSTALNVSTVHRLLHLMAQDEIVSYDAKDRTYRVGTEFMRLAAKVLGSESLVGRVRPVVADLAEQLDETCAFAIYEPKRRTKVIAIVERGTHPLGYHFEIGSRDGLHAGASGKAILAFLPDDEIEQILSGPLPKLTEFTVVDPAELRREILEIREKGYSTSGGERIPGAGFGIGAPVFGPHKGIVGSIVVTVPAFRWYSGRLPVASRKLIETADRITALANLELGGVR